MQVLTWRSQSTNFWRLPYNYKQVAQLWQRDRASSINDFRWGQFEAIIDWEVTFRAIATALAYARAVIKPSQKVSTMSALCADMKMTRRKKSFQKLASNSACFCTSSALIRFSMNSASFATRTMWSRVAWASNLHIAVSNNHTYWSLTFS